MKVIPRTAKEMDNFFAELLSEAAHGTADVRRLNAAVGIGNIRIKLARLQLAAANQVKSLAGKLALRLTD